MGTIPSIISTDTVTFFVKGAPYSVDKSFAGYQTVIDLLKLANPDTDALVAATQPVRAIEQAVAKAESLVDPETGLEYLPKGTVSVTNSEIRFNGEVVTGVLVDRILAMLAEGFDIMPMVRFMENLYQNPADFAREELYLWLENSNLPITEDGCFLAYKSVRPDYKSHHDGRTDNTPGVVVSMPRQNVDPVRDRTCSRGLHFCSLSYLGKVFSNNTIVILKVNPADVVSIPSDYNNSKGRAWKYLVLSKFGEEANTKVWPAVVSATGETVVKAYPNDAPLGDHPLVIGSDLAKALFAACNEIGKTDRSRRLAWAQAVLNDPSVESFEGITVGEASTLLEAARSVKTIADAAAESAANLARSQARSAANAAKRAEAIESYGIERLRRLASAAGWTKANGTSAYKGPKSADLRKFLIDLIK